MARGIFFSDIDGTLLKGDSGISPEVRAAAGEFMAAGGLLVLCTGRSVMGALPVARELRVNAPGIVFGGAAIYDFELGEPLWSQPCDSSIHASLSRLFDGTSDIGALAFTMENVYLCRECRRLLERGNKVELAAAKRPPFKIDEPVMKLLFAADDAAALADCARFFTPEKFTFALASRHFAEAAPAGATKGETAARLAEMLGVPPERCFSAGDGHTDLPLFRFTGLSFAPANASDAIRAAADVEIPAADEGGMAVAFRRAALAIS